MPRPKGCRRVAGPPGCVLFKPAGVPSLQLREIVLGIDEMEAMRLGDLEGLYHEQAAEHMNVSRQTFGRIVSTARRKVAEALVHGLALRIEGGEIEMAQQRTFTCLVCGHEWQLPFGIGRPAACPQCASTSIRRTDRHSVGGRGTRVSQDSKGKANAGRAGKADKERGATALGAPRRSRGRTRQRGGRGSRGAR